MLRDGRLPDPDAPDEAFVNEAVAKGAGLDVGDRLTFRLFEPGSDTSVATTVSIVGIGTLPVEAVSDETRTSGVIVFSRAFHDAHRELAAYSVSNVDLAPGFDAPRDLAAAVGSLGHELQSARSLETDATNEALRPLIIVVVALGLLAFGATAVGRVAGGSTQPGPQPCRQRRRCGPLGRCGRSFAGSNWPPRR